MPAAIPIDSDEIRGLSRSSSLESLMALPPRPKSHGHLVLGLAFGQEEIDDFADLTYSDRRTFLLLSLLYPFVDLSNQFHIDHIYPISRFTPVRLRKESVPEDKIYKFIDTSNCLGNLQLLEGKINNEKRTPLPADWLKQRSQPEEEHRNYCLLHDLNDVPESIEHFDRFYDDRRARLLARIANVVN